MAGLASALRLVCSKTSFGFYKKASLRYNKKLKTDSTKGEKPPMLEDQVASYLHWAAKQGYTPGFTEWKKIDHPDFPGQTVEVGDRILCVGESTL
jgi:hypothetical protein